MSWPCDDSQLVERSPWDIRDWASRQRTGDPTAKLLLLVLAEHANSHGVCWPGQRRLADLMEVSERTVRRTLSQLTELGLVFVRRRVVGRTATQNEHLLACCVPDGQEAPQPANVTGPRPADVAAPGDTPRHRGRSYERPHAASPSSVEVSRNSQGASPSAPRGEIPPMADHGEMVAQPRRGDPIPPDGQPEPPQPALRKPRDPVWDALVEAWTGDPTSRVPGKQSSVGKARRDIADAHPDLDDTALAERIRAAAREFERRWPDAGPPPPWALARHWPALTAGVEQRRRKARDPWQRWCPECRSTQYGSHMDSCPQHPRRVREQGVAG